MVPPDLLVDIGYDPTRATRHLELSTASGLVMAPLLRIRALKCLGLTIKHVEVVAHHLPPESPVEGLLGLNALIHFKPFQVFCQTLQPFAV
jgi:predicted aspartyl protease